MAVGRAPLHLSMFADLTAAAADAATSAATNDGFRLSLLLTAYGLGFRHGIDWDHIAAITDLTSGPLPRRRAATLSTLYALGHSLVVFLLGVVLIMAGREVPPGVDAFMGKVVGVTLLALAVYVFASLARQGRDFRPRSRWMLALGALRRCLRWLEHRRSGQHEMVEIEHAHEHQHDLPYTQDGSHQHTHGLTTNDAAATGRHAVATAQRHAHLHRHRVSMPDDPFPTYSRSAAFTIGMLHGIGAETPTQVLLFVTAAHVAGEGTGVLLLGAFIAGLLTSNGLITVTSVLGHGMAARAFPISVVVAAITGVFSLVLGTMLLTGTADALPPILSSG